MRLRLRLATKDKANGEGLSDEHRIFCDLERDQSG